MAMTANGLVKLLEEMGDVAAAIVFVQVRFSLDGEAIASRADAKLAKFEEWHANPSNGAEAYHAEVGGEK